MKTPVFDTLEELTANFLEHRGQDSFCLVLDGVHVSEDMLEDAQVDRPGWYFVRSDLKRFLPLKHCIHRRPLGTKPPALDIPEWAYAAAGG